MKLKEIKKYKDQYCTTFILNCTSLIKKQFNIPQQKRVFFIDYWNDKAYFLYNNKIFIPNFNKKGNEELYICSLYVVTLENKKIANFETIIPDDTTPIKNQLFNIESITKKETYTKDDFYAWYNSPSQVNLNVNVPYSTTIEFLQNYNKQTFKTDRYLFYVKRDNDLTYAFFIYAKDLQTKADLKIYVNFRNLYPENLKDTFVQDLSGTLSEYQIKQCKKAFIKFCNSYCKELQAPNFYALELVKQSIQPIEFDRGWAVDRPFHDNFEFNNIWLDDELMYDEKPYFLMTDKVKNFTKIAALDFYKPAYKSTKLYISRYRKYNHWDIDIETLKRLTRFLNEPFDFKNIAPFNYFESDIKTNWQWLITTYNENTAIYPSQMLPLDLPIPDWAIIKYKNKKK